MSDNTTKRCLYWIAIFFGAYLCAYIILSSCGGYYFTQSGRQRWHGTGLAVTDMIIWHPRFVWYQSDYMFADGKIGTRGNFLGYLFVPLVQLDRRCIHPSKKDTVLMKKMDAEVKHSPPSPKEPSEQSEEKAVE